MLEQITISMEEYKELLMIKGKYEELKSQQITKVDLNNWNIKEVPLTMPTYYGTGAPIPEELTRVTCNKDFNGLDAVN